MQIRLEEVEATEPRLSDCQKQYFAEISERFAVSFDPYAGEGEDLDKGRQWHFLAYLDEKLCGCGSLRDLGTGIAEVKRVWSDKSVRGMGIGTQLMDRLESVAQKEGFLAVRLDTNHTLGEAQAMYRKRGFVEIERYNDNPFADHFFEKRL